MTDPREAYLAAVAEATAVLGRPETAVRWEEPSALAGLSTAALAGHLLRSLLTVERYLQQPEPRGEPISPSGYYHSLPLSADPETALNQEVRALGEQTAAAGADVVASAAAAAQARLAAHLPDEDIDRLVLVTNGLVLTLGDYLATRIVELLVHADDLAVSAGVALPPPDGAAAGVVIDTLVGLARLRHGDLAVVRALARRERDSPGALRVL